MNLEDIKKWLDQNKDDAEVGEFLNSLSAVDATKVTGFLESEEGQRLLQPKLDKHFTKGLDTWKENNLQKIVEEELAKLNPEETEEQKRIRELESRLNQAEKEKKNSEMLSKINSMLSENKLPTELSNILLAEDEEVVKKNIESYKSVIESVRDNVKQDLLKNNGRDDLGGSSSGGTGQDDKMKQVAAAFFGEGNKDAFAEKASQQYFKEES